MKLTGILLAFSPAIAMAASPFDGTWVARVDTVTIKGKPDTYLLADGMYHCGPCSPSYKIKADGTDQKVAGHAYYDTVSATVVDANTLQVKASAAGKPWSEHKLTVTADGKTLTDEFISYEGASPVKATFVATRVGGPPAGAHAISGSWKPDPHSATLPPEFTTVTFVQTVKGVQMKLPTGENYDAKFDGKEYLTEGDPGKTMVTLKRITPLSFEETDKRKGKITDIWSYTVSADGKTLHSVDRDPVHGTTMSYDSAKQ